MATAWKNLNRVRFAKRLNENIKNMSHIVKYMGGGITMAPVNFDFAYELIEIFNETIVQLLLEGETINFDQFGKYEIKVQEKKKMKTPFTNNQEVILPELKMIRFYPALRLKERIRGEVSGRVKRNFNFKDDNIELPKFIEDSEENDDGD